MPLTEIDVLSVLSDPIVLSLDFRVGPVHISGKSFAIIREHILAENILVASGNQGLAFYDQKTDVLTTQAGNSPANLDQKAQLLHECTHALVDIFTSDISVTRHVDELSSYLTQFVYMMRSNPSYAVGPNNLPWFVFYTSIYLLIKRFRLDTSPGNPTRVGVDDLEPLRKQLAALPYVNYGNFKEDDATGANGLLRNNPYLESREEVSTRSSNVAYEAYPDPSDDYLIGRLMEKYAATDVRGYGQRARDLRKDFALCSLVRAKALATRLPTRRPGDRLSVAFHDRLSTAERALLLRVLRNRI